MAIKQIIMLLKSRNLMLRKVVVGWPQDESADWTTASLLIDFLQSWLCFVTGSLSMRLLDLVRLLI